LASPNPSGQQFNEWANSWRYDVGVPTIPGEFKTKKPSVYWEGYQENPPCEEEHKEWLKQGKYSGGIMILCGTPCYRKDRQEQHLFLVGIDIDRQKGIDAFCTRDGKIASLKDDIGRQTLVEQHEDAPDRCHIFLYSPFKFPVKRPDDVLGIEIKSSWDHGLMRVTPSVTEGGYPLRIIGTAREPHILNELEANELLQHLNHICIDNGVEYLQKDKNDTNSNSFLTPGLRQVIKSLDVSFATMDKVKIASGYRNVTLISVANSILFNHLDKDRTNEDILDKLCTEEEFSGLLHEVLGRLPRIIRQGIRPNTNETMRETYEKYVRGSSPIKYFREKALRLTNTPEDIVSKDTMYDSYLLFCRANKIATETEQAFSRKLSDIGFEYKRVKRNKIRDYYWVGVQIVDWRKVEDSEQQTLTDLTVEQRGKLDWE
jgi:hypothetical protein